MLAGRWAYLHAGGAIGEDGLIPDVEVSLPDELSRYSLPEPPEDAIGAIRASLDFLEVGPATVTVPLYSSIWRSILGDADCAIHNEGPTGAGKTALSALVQQHFGAEMNARNLPGSWTSTANALERLAFLAKDAVLVG